MLDFMKKRSSVVMLIVILWLLGQTVPTHAQGTERLAAEPATIQLEERLPDGSLHMQVLFFAEADTYLASNEPELNFGDSAGLLLNHTIGTENFGAERILLRFNFQNLIPADAMINDARLSLYLNSSNPSNDSPLRTEVRRLTTPWDEDLVRWENQPTTGDVRATATIASRPGPYEWIIPTLVRDWVQQIHPNYGLEVVGAENIQQRERLFYARESESHLMPKLLVDFTIPPPDTAPPIVTVDPLPAFTRPTFTVSWSGADQGEAGLAYFDVDYRINGTPWQPWLRQTTATSALFTGDNAHQYEFRARGVDTLGNVERFGVSEAVTIVDNLLPAARANPLPVTTEQRTFLVGWESTDGFRGSGVRCVDVHYRVNQSSWTLWLDCVRGDEAVFVAPQDGFYEFEVRATDYLNIQETLTGEPEASTLVITPPPPTEIKVWIPIVVGNR